MKANNGTGNHSGRDAWQTDPALWNQLDAQYGFTFDCCAQAHNTKTEHFSSDFLKLIADDFDDEMAWMNPPFSQAKLMFEHFVKVVNKGVAIYRCDNLETHVWQQLILPNCKWVFVPSGRVQYIPDVPDERGNGSRFPSALIGLNVQPPLGFKGSLLWSA